MSVAPFEQFLLERLKQQLRERITAGQRFQFRSPNFANTAALHQRAEAIADGHVQLGPVNLPWVNVGEVRLICVAHSEATNGSAVGFNENYIAMLRDKVASQAAQFEQSALLIVHNSLLDTLLNSAIDLGANSAPWNARTVCDDLVLQAQSGQRSALVIKCLLEWQATQIEEEQSSAFAFRQSYESLSRQQDPDFPSLGLFKDKAIFDLTSEGQIQRRLRENRELHEEIATVVHHFPDDIEERLPYLSPSFIKSHFESGVLEPWDRLDIQDFWDEIESHGSTALEFATVELEAGTLYGPRNTRDTGAGQRRKNLIIAVPVESNTFQLTFVFITDDLDLTHVKRSGNSAFQETARLDIKKTRNRRRIVLTSTFDKSPTYFTISLDRSQTAERFEFHCLAVQEGDFHIAAFENSFLVNVVGKGKAESLTLQTEEQELLINPTRSERRVLDENNSVVDSSEFGTVDFHDLYEDSETVSFSVLRNGRKLKFNIEGELSQQTLTVPLLFDEGRFNLLFDDGYNGTFLPERSRVVLDSKESSVVGGVLSLLRLESQFVEERLLSIGSPSTAGLRLKEICPAMYAAWKGLMDYFAEKRTVPSLASWGGDLVDRATAYVSEYVKYLQLVQLGQNLSEQTRLVLQLGMVNRDGKHFMSPFHPLILGYYVALVTEVTNDESRSFRNLPQVTKSRLTPRGLLPFVYSSTQEFSHTQTNGDNCFWLEVVPQEQTNYEFVRKLTREKIEEFVSTFGELFLDSSDAPLLLNSMNNVTNEEVFLGIVDYFRAQGLKSQKVHVNLYDDELTETEFDRLAECSKYDEIKKRYDLERSKQTVTADTIIDLLRTRLTFSKFRTHDEPALQYAHITLFKNNEKVQRVDTDIRKHISGVSCRGLLSGEASCCENGSYFTGFGLRDTDTNGFLHLEVARLVGTLLKPAHSVNDTYHDSSAIRLAISDRFKERLQRSYEGSLWVTLIDPKVTLEFFADTRDVVLIHFSDQYTNSAGYDAITVTKESGLYTEILEHGTVSSIGEFNAFNGEWLLKMVTALKNTRTEREGILGAWKLISCLLADSDIVWVPLSVAELIRVSGNIGLKMSESDFSRHHKHSNFKGAISDDIVFAGFKAGKLYLLPVEVKTGATPDFTKAVTQVRKLSEFLKDGLLAPRTLEGQLYRSLFVAQVLMQIEKYELYEVFEKDYFAPIKQSREDWLFGDFELAELADFPTGFVVSNLNSVTAFQTRFSDEDDVAKFEIPIGFLKTLVGTPRTELEKRLAKDNFLHIPDRYFLGRIASTPVTVLPPAEPIIENIPWIAVAVAELPAAPSVPELYVADSKKLEPIRIQFGTDLQTNNKVFWEPTNTQKVLNPNTAIIGTMGTGKTQFTKSVITQLLRQQDRNVGGSPIGVLILDYKSDYTKQDFVKATNAKVLKLHRLPFNPFALFGSRPMLPMHTANLFRSTLATAFNLGNRQQNRIRNLVMEAYREFGISPDDSKTWQKTPPTLWDVWKLYLDQDKVEEDSLYAALDDLVSFEIFETDPSKVQSLYDLVTGVVVLDLSGYDPTIQNLVVAITLDIFYTQMHQYGSSTLEGAHRQLCKLILVDEADNFMRQDFTSLRSLLKEGREFGVGTILSTQELTHFKTSQNDYSGYILSWIIHRVAKIAVQDVKAIFNAESKQAVDDLMREIRELEKHESLYIDGDKRLQKLRDLAFWEL
jgi:DNA phosphorothioation-dependent restriction protein DptH